MSHKLYRRKEWIEFREKCFEYADFTCAICGRNQEHVVLNVHHPHYEQGKLPWEYEVEDCEVLCKGCHAREHGIIEPEDWWIRKRRQRELKVFLESPHWTLTRRGWRYKHEDREVFILNKYNQYWMLKINGTWGKLRYEDLDDAKSKAFNVLSA